MTTSNPEVIELISKIGKFSSGPAESVYIRCKEAIRRLGEIGDPAAVEPLIAVMHKYQTSDRTGRIKESCSLALVTIGDLGGVKAVQEDGDHTVVLNWVRGLIGLKEFDKHTKLDLDDIQATIPEDYIEPLIEYLRGSWHGDSKGMVVIALGCISDDDRVIDALRNALDDDDHVAAMGAFGLAFPILGLPIRDYLVGELAGLSLVRLGDRESASRIIQLALGTWWRAGQNPKDRFIQLMYLLGWESVVPTLTQIGGTFPGKDWRTWPVREKAIACLVAIGDTKVIGPLLGYLNDPVPDVREKAAKALGEVGDSSTLEALGEGLKDKKSAVRRAAKKAVTQIEARHGSNLSPK